MLTDLAKRVKDWQKRTSWSFGDDISTPKARRQAHLHRHLVDHAFLRTIWTNLAEIAPGVWRSNQPSPRRLVRLKAMGITTILNLRGEDRYSFYLFEREACAELGITLIDLKIYARSLVPRDRYMELFAIFDRIEKPFLLHCKSGADRAGLVAALWLLDQEGAGVPEARRMLSLRYMHLKRTRTGLMDHLLDVYEADSRSAPMSVRDWFATRYDPAALTASFHDKMGWPRPEAA